jgi:hypothetical protein
MDLDSEIQSSNKIDTAIPRQLVLDYLLHNCYGETARAFMKDDLDAVKDTSDSAANGRKYGGSASATNGASSAAVAVPQGGVMTRNASSESNNNNNNNNNNDDIHHRRARQPASLMMDTEKEELDQEGDSPMGESYLDTRDSLSTSTFTADKAHALLIDEQLKNLETRKGTLLHRHIYTITTTTRNTVTIVSSNNNRRRHYPKKKKERMRRKDKGSRIRGNRGSGEEEEEGMERETPYQTHVSLFFMYTVRVACVLCVRAREHSLFYDYLILVENTKPMYGSLIFSAR